MVILFFSNLIFSLSAQTKYPFREYGGFDMFFDRDFENKYGFVDFPDKISIPIQYD